MRTLLALAGEDAEQAAALSKRLEEVLGRRGRVAGPVDRILSAAVLSRFVHQKLSPLIAKPSKADLQFLKELLEAGKVTPVIDRTYSLSEVPDAIRYLEEGHARGKIVVIV